MFRSSHAPRIDRSRFRMLALGLAGALVAPLALAAAVAPAAAFGNGTMPIDAGSPSSAAGEFGGTPVEVTYSEVPESGLVYIEVFEHDPDAYSEAPAGFEPLVAVRVMLLSDPDTNQVAPGITSTTCVDLTELALTEQLTAWTLDFPTETWLPTSVSSTASTYCIEGSEPDALLLLTRDASIAVSAIDVAVTRVFEPLEIGFGDGPQNGVHLVIDAVNTGTVPETLGLGADLRVEGVDEKLWLDSTWGLDEGSGVGDFFSVEILPGETVSMQVPDWPGKTYSFWSVNAVNSVQSTLIDEYETGGLFSRVAIDINDGTVEIGSIALFAGDSVFPGVTTTVEAIGLIPGEAYELWLTPGVDYLSFMLLGGILADGAVQVGTAVVDASGRLATAFGVPASAVVGTSYQLMIGDPDSRSWPAGTASSLQIVAPDDGGTVDGPAPSELEVSIPVGGIDVLFSFPAGATEGTTTAVVSTTGPAAVGFTIPGTPPIYLHLSTTAEFTGDVEVCVGVAGGVDPTGLRLYHYELSPSGYAWVDITTRYELDAVCGETDSFSPFALGVSDGVRLTSKEQCKNGGWATSTVPVFRNQGQCVMQFARLR